MGVYYVAGIPYGQTDELYHFGRKGMKWGQNVFTTWAEYLQGKGLGGAANVARGAAKGLGRLNEYINGDNARSALSEAIRNRENVNQARSAYNRTLSGQVQNLRRNAGNAFNNARNQAGQAFNNARTQAGQAFNNARTQAGQGMSNARNAVTTAYAEAAKKVGGAGRNIEQFYNDVMAKAQDQIRAGKQMVSAYGNQAMSSIQELGKKALEGPKNWLDAMLKRFNKKNNNEPAQANMRERRNQKVNSESKTTKNKNAAIRKQRDAGRSRAESNGDNYVPNYQRVNAKSIGPDLPGWKNGKKIKR